MIRMRENKVNEVVGREMNLLKEQIKDEQVGLYILRISELMAQGLDEDAITQNILEEMGT